MRRQRPNYKRILGIALGVSLLVHVVVIGFGRLSLGSRGNSFRATTHQPGVLDSSIKFGLMVSLCRFFMILYPP